MLAWCLAQLELLKLQRQVSPMILDFQASCQFLERVDRANFWRWKVICTVVYSPPN